MRLSGRLAIFILSFSILAYGFSGAINAQEVTDTTIPPLSVETDLDLYAEGNTITVSGQIRTLNTDFPVDVTIVIRDSSGNFVSIAQVSPNSDGTYSKTFIASGTFKVAGEYSVEARYGAQTAETTFTFAGGEGYTPPPPPPPPEPEPEPEPVCGPGTHLENGVCVPDQPAGGGGCLIATATFGTEFAPQVQMLREIRDSTVLNTASGTSFMTAFNQFYYSFSPTIADMERENEVFKETVKIAITPLLTSLSLLNFVDIDSEEEMLGYGIGIILLNLGMYFVAPAMIIIAIKKRRN